MKSFAFFASIFAQAIAAIATPITIKDNKPYALDFRKFKCEGSSRLTVTLLKAKGRQTYLYPVFQKKQHIKLFKLTHGKYVKSKRNKKLPKGKNHGSKYRSVLAKYKIKKVLFTSNNKNPKYSVYVIPPKGSRRTVQGKPHKLNVDIQADFECRDKNNNTQQEIFTTPITFTSN
ncbi:hypothetical protein DSO57_1006287 [Entomophthora muscae]|uniref:Uncharacterized protein n=1 Tax=Entomophthora muscae TaxID=34485 RepID=A0ACC2SKB1_9FUNG|nr:hypothetical protein DSO57_1006287 [Entomophthora muscae]